jgi:hypothetical protein
MPLHPDDLGPFLPGGKKLTVEEEDPKDEYEWTTGCRVVVDGEPVLATTVEWREKGTSTAWFAAGISQDKPDRSSGDGRFLWDGRQGFGRTEGCRDPEDGDLLFTAVRAYGSDHRDAAAMKRIITAFTKAVEESDACDSAGKL